VDTTRRGSQLTAIGRWRGDSKFHLNNAFKSVTIAPKVENLDYYLSVYQQALDFKDGLTTDPGEYSLDWKKALLRNYDFWIVGYLSLQISILDRVHRLTRVRGG